MKNFFEHKSNTLLELINCCIFLLWFLFSKSISMSKVTQNTEINPKNNFFCHISSWVTSRNLVTRMSMLPYYARYQNAVKQDKETTIFLEWDNGIICLTSGHLLTGKVLNCVPLMHLPFLILKKSDNSNWSLC